MAPSKKRKTPTPTPTPTPSPSKPPQPPQPPPVGPQVEYRHSYDDDAWYSVQLVLSNNTLTIKFTEFPDDQDVVFNVDEFTTIEEVMQFVKLFRPLSFQLKGSDCGRVSVGLKVCAIRDLGDQGRRYFDAIVEAVKHEEHTIVDETEGCTCSVVLSWLHGPEEGMLTLARVEDLCLIQSDTLLDPRLACFLELVKWKHDIALPHSNLISEDILFSKKSPTLFLCEKCKSQTLIQKSEGRKQLGSAVPCDEGNLGDEEVDLGRDLAVAAVDHSSFSFDKLAEDVFCFGLEEGDNLETKILDREAYYFILVENMEKDLSSSTIVSFIQEVTGLKIEACVFLSLSPEPYTSGALVVDCVEDLERLCDFVVKPEQMIVSSKGRPWIVSGPSATESVRPSFWCLEPDLKNERQPSAGDGLKVVEVGSEEYCKAEKMRNLFLDYANHQQNLSKRLALLEQSVLDA